MQAEASDVRLDITLAGLRAQFPGRAAITPGEALTAIGVATRDPENAARLRCHRGNYPFPVILHGGRRMVLIADIALVLCDAPAADGDARIEGDTRRTVKRPLRAAPVTHTQKRRPGRPRKIANAPQVQEASHG